MTPEDAALVARLRRVSTIPGYDPEICSEATARLEEMAAELGAWKEGLARVTGNRKQLSEVVAFVEDKAVEVERLNAEPVRVIHDSPSLLDAARRDADHWEERAEVENARAAAAEAAVMKLRVALSACCHVAPDWSAHADRIKRGVTLLDSTAALAESIRQREAK